MNIGLTIVWTVVAVAVFGFMLVRYIRGRKDTKTARDEFSKRVNGTK